MHVLDSKDLLTTQVRTKERPGNRIPGVGLSTTGRGLADVEVVLSAVHRADWIRAVRAGTRAGLKGDSSMKTGGGENTLSPSGPEILNQC